MTEKEKEWAIEDVFDALGRNDADQLELILKTFDSKKINAMAVPQAKDFGQRGTKLTPTQNFLKETGMTPLQLLCLAPGNAKIRMVMLRNLLECGADPNQVSLDSAQSALFFSVLSESLEVLKELVNHKGNPHLIDKNGNSLLHCACQIGKIEIVKYLLEECKVDMHQRNESGWFPYHVALRFNSREVVEYLLEKGQEVNEKMSTDPEMKNEFPIFILARFGHFPLAKFLVERKGMDACPPGTDIQPSKVAHQNNHTKFSQFLMKYKRKEEPNSTNVTKESKSSTASTPSIEEQEIERGERCANCKKKEEKKEDLKHCGKCQKLAYCSRECQVAHWKTHKLTCK